MKHLLLIISVVNIFSLRAQENLKNIRSIWLDVGAGYAPHLYSNSKGVSFSISGQYRSDRNLLCFRTIWNYERFIAEGPHPVKSVREISILYGRSVTGDLISNIIFLVGIASVRKLERGKLIPRVSDVDGCYEKLYSKTAGLAFGLKYMVNTKISVFCIDIFCDVNKFRSFIGFLISFGLGKLY